MLTEVSVIPMRVPGVSAQHPLVLVITDDQHILSCEDLPLQMRYKHSSVESRHGPHKLKSGGRPPPHRTTTIIPTMVFLLRRLKEATSLRLMHTNITCFLM